VKRILSLSWKVYSLAAAVALALLLGGLGAGAALGKVTLSGLQASAAALLSSGGPAGGAADAAAGTAAPEAKEESGAIALQGSAAASAMDGAPIAVLKEIERAAEDLRMWEDRINLLGKDVGKQIVSASERDQTLEERIRAWSAVEKSAVALLNELLAGTPGWKPITETELMAALRGEAAAGSPTPAGSAAAKAGSAPMAELLDRLRRREKAIAAGVESLRALSPDVLAGILAAGWKEPGGRNAAGRSLEESEIVRLLGALEPSKLVKVFKVLTDEDPSQAAEIMALVLRRPAGEGSEGGEREGNRAETKRSEAVGPLVRDSGGEK